MAVRSETELYSPVKSFFELQGYEIKSEVRNCDLVGLKDGQNQPLIVEMKKVFNLSLLLQGMQRLKMSDDVYLAVERNRAKRGAVNQRWGELTELCRSLGLGLITVTFYKTKQPFVEVLCRPGQGNVASTRRLKTRQERLLYEFNARSGDYNTGGSARHKLVTAYREKSLRVAAALQHLEQESPAKLARDSGVSSAGVILQRNYYGWFTRISRGRYALTEEGRTALMEYAEVLEGQQREKNK